MHVAAEAFEKQNTDFLTELGKSFKGQKRLSITSFKGQYYYDVREFFEDREGNLRPTRKGASLSSAVWRRLVALTPHVDAAIQSLKAARE